MVAATVEVAHGLCFIALTTTSPSTAIRMIMISQDADQRGEAADRAELFTRHLAERLAVAPQRAARITKSCTHPPSTAPITIHSVQGR